MMPLLLLAMSYATKYDAAAGGIGGGDDDDDDV